MNHPGKCHHGTTIGLYCGVCSAEKDEYIHQLEGWLAEVRERSAKLLAERNELRRLLAERDRTIDSLREGMRRAMNEIGVPGDGYPQNIANAYSILNGDCYQPRPEGGE
jgi:hypothetical protein